MRRHPRPRRSQVAQLHKLQVGYGVGGRHKHAVGLGQVLQQAGRSVGAGRSGPGGVGRRQVGGGSTGAALPVLVQSTTGRHHARGVPRLGSAPTRAPATGSSPPLAATPLRLLLKCPTAIWARWGTGHPARRQGSRGRSPCFALTAATRSVRCSKTMHALNRRRSMPQANTRVSTCHAIPNARAHCVALRPSGLRATCCVVWHR